MNSRIARRILGLALASLAAASQVSLASAGSAAPSIPPNATPPPNATLTAKPSIITATLKPGETNTTSVTLTAGVDLDVKISALGLGESVDGSFQTLAVTDDHSPYTARSWITVEPSEVQLPAGTSKTIKVTTHAPATPGEGTRYATIEALGVPSGDSGNVGVGVSLGLSEVITIADSQLLRKGELDGLAVAMPLAGPLVATAILNNTGDTHYGMTPYGLTTAATVQPIVGGTVLAEAKNTLIGNSIVPTFGRQVSVSLGSDTPLSDGRYHLEMESRLTDGTLIAQAALDFDISHGGIAGATSAPATGLPGTGESTVNGLSLVLGVLLGGSLVFLVFAILSRRDREKPRRGAGAGGLPGAGGDGGTSSGGTAG